MFLDKTRSVYFIRQINIHKVRFGFWASYSSFVSQGIQYSVSGVQTEFRAFMGIQYPSYFV